MIRNGKFCNRYKAFGEMTSLPFFANFAPEKGFCDTAITQGAYPKRVTADFS